MTSGFVYLLFFVSILFFFIIILIISFVFSLWLVFYVSRGRVSFFILFLAILLSVQYFFIFLFAFRSYVYFGPEVSMELTKTLLEQSLSPIDIEEVAKSPSTLSWYSRMYVVYMLVFFGLSLFCGSGALFYYSFIPPSPSYPVVEAAFARGPLIVFPESSSTVFHIVNVGPVLMLEWPYISSYAPVDLPLGLTNFKALLHMLPLLDMKGGEVGTAVDINFFRQGVSGVTALQSLVEVSMMLPLSAQDIFTPAMFVEIPVESFWSLPEVLSDSQLVHLSNFYPSLHPSCLSMSLSAEDFHSFGCGRSPVFSQSTIVPAELVPSPWHW